MAPMWPARVYGTLVVFDRPPVCSTAFVSGVARERTSRGEDGVGWDSVEVEWS
jgi:hypothetical protein